jgi:hypothetical protein
VTCCGDGVVQCSALPVEAPLLHSQQENKIVPPIAGIFPVPGTRSFSVLPGFCSTNWTYFLCASCMLSPSQKNLRAETPSPSSDLTVSFTFPVRPKANGAENEKVEAMTLTKIKLFLTK